MVNLMGNSNNLFHLYHEHRLSHVWLFISTLICTPQSHFSLYEKKGLINSITKPLPLYEGLQMRATRARGCRRRRPADASDEGPQMRATRGRRCRRRRPADAGDEGQQMRAMKARRCRRRRPADAGDEGPQMQATKACRCRR